MDESMKDYVQNPKVMIIANAPFTITNFRSELIRSLLDSGSEVVVVCPESCDLSVEDDVANIFRSIGATFRPINFERSGINPLSDALLLLRLIQLIKKERPNIVLNYTIKATIYGSIAAYLCKVGKIASNITGLGYAFTSKGLRARIIQIIVSVQYTIALKFNDVVFFQNIDDLSLFEQKGLITDLSKTKILSGSGVNLDVFSPDNSIKKVPQSFIFVGRLLKDKGVIEFIEAAKKIKKDYPTAYFRLVGALDDNPACISKKFLDEVVSEGVLEYISPTPNVLTYLRESEVFVLPSYREGTPKSVLEAMATGLPIITTDAPGCRETVVDKCNGFLVNVNDIDSLYGAMRSLINDKDLRSKMGKASLERARTIYDVHKVNQSILESLIDLT